MGKETRPSKIVAAPGFFGDGRVESTAPSSSTRMIRRSAGTGCTMRIAMAVEQRVELCPQRGETAGLDLHQFAVRAHEVDHVAVDAHLERVAGRRRAAP